MTKDRGPVNLITFQPQGPMGTSHHFGYEAINSAYQTWQLVRRHVTDNILYKIFQRLISLQAQDSHTPHRGYYFSLKHLYMLIPSFCFQYICSFHCSILNLKHLHILISLLLFSTSNTCMCSFHYSLFSHEACICSFLYSNFSHEHTYIFIPLLCLSASNNYNCYNCNYINSVFFTGNNKYILIPFLRFQPQKPNTVNSRYFELAYFELPLISKWKSGPCFNMKLWQQVTK